MYLECTPQLTHDQTKPFAITLFKISYDIGSHMIRIGALLMVFLASPTMAAKVDNAYCSQAHDAAAVRLQWALGHPIRKKTIAAAFFAVSSIKLP